MRINQLSINPINNKISYKQNKDNLTSKPNNYYEEQKIKLMRTGIGSFCLFGATMGGMWFFSLMLKHAKSPSNAKNALKHQLNNNYKKVHFEDLNNNIPYSNDCKSLDKKLKDFIDTQVLIKNSTSDLLNDLGLIRTNRILLTGKPGVGKTHFSKILAKDLNAKYGEIKYSDINSKWIGENIEKMDFIFKDAIETAKENPKNLYVLTINEIDSLMTPIEHLTNGSSGNIGIVKGEMRGTFLSFLDELSEKTPNIIIIGTTNLNPKNKKLDNATLSRFQEIIELPMPNADLLHKALVKQLSKNKYTAEILEKNSKELKEFSKKIEKEGFSFRDLEQLVKKSKEECFKNILKDKNEKYKFSYLEKAMKGLDFTDGKL